MFDNLTGTFDGLGTTGSYMNQIVDSVEPTVDFLYDNILTNPIFIGIVLVILILSLFNYD